jgi:hypothetical protein
VSGDHLGDVELVEIVRRLDPVLGVAVVEEGIQSIKAQRTPADVES